MLSVRGIRIAEPLLGPVDDVGSYVVRQLEAAGEQLEAGDVLVLSSKLVSIAQGRLYDQSLVVPLEDARALAAEAGEQPAMVEAALRESYRALGHAAGIVITLRNEGLTPNSGIDRSNAPHGLMVLPPSRPFEVADEIRWKVEAWAGAQVGVVIADSRVLPLRRGTVGLAVSFSGLRGALDQRGKADLFGRRLHYTYRAIADEVASAAELVMGEADELMPIAIVGGMGEYVDGRRHRPDEVRVDPSECLYARALSGTQWRELRA